MNTTATTTYRVSISRDDMNADDIYDMISRSYWAEKRTKPLVEGTIKHSCCVGIFSGTKQIAFARVITDYTTYAYICDVIVHEDHRGQGLGKMLMRTILDHPDLRTIQVMSLATKDAHGLYEQFGFKVSEFPENRLELRNRP